MAKKEKSVGVAVPVDIGKLSAGLTMTFKGVSMVFDSIGAEEKPGFGVVEDAEGATEDSADATEKVPAAEEPVEADKTADTAEASADTDEKEACDDTNGSNDADGDAEGSRDEAEGSGDEAAGDQEGSKKAPAHSDFSLTDLQNVAAEKVKQNKKNSSKIGSLVKTYGVNALSELPADKYEAFMTDLSQL